ncbi:hypothetical protein IGK28_000038 [Enterococcus sp. DIV0182]
MKRKILIATILSMLVLPSNVSYAAENEELLAVCSIFSISKFCCCRILK